MANVKLSQIAVGNALAAATDQLVAVRNGNSDVLVSPATVAGTGAYADLINKPTLGTAAAQPTSAFDPAGAAASAQAASLQKSSNLSDLGNAASARTNLGLVAVAASGSFADLSNKPGLAAYIPNSTFASLPTPSAAGAGAIYNVTDIGSGGTHFISNGSIWRPANGVAVLAASAVAASVTGTTAETILATVNIPANLMTANGHLRVNSLWSNTNSANNKTANIRFSGVAGTLYYSPTLTTALITQAFVMIRNRNATNSQVGFATGTVTGLGSSGNPKIATAYDTTAATSLVFSGVLANAADSLTLEDYLVELIIP